MTLQSAVSRVLYEGNGAQTDFPIPFRFQKKEHIAVFHPSGIFTPGTDYDVTGTVQGKYYDGGSVVFHNAPSGAIAVLRMVPFVQESDYVPNGDVPAETLEGNLDYLTMQTQQLKEEVERCVKMPETSAVTPEEWLDTWTMVLTDAKDIALDASVSAANSAASASSCLSIISTIMTELTGDPAWAEESLHILEEIWKAKGGVEAAREAAIGDITNKADVAKAAVEEAARQSKEAAEQSINNKLVDAETQIDASISAAVGADGVLDAALEAAKGALNSDIKEALDNMETVASGYIKDAKDAVDAAIADWEAIRDQAIADGNKALEDLANAKLAALSEINSRVTAAQTSSDNAYGYAQDALQKAQSAASEAAKAEAARKAAEAAESNIGNVVNTSLTAHNLSASAHENRFANIQTALNGKAPMSHTHGIGAVTGLQDALNGKAPVSHTHGIGAVTGLQDALNGKADSSTVTKAVSFPNYAAGIDVTGAYNSGYTAPQNGWIFAQKADSTGKGFYIDGGLIFYGLEAGVLAPIKAGQVFTYRMRSSQAIIAEPPAALIFYPNL